MNVLVVGGAGYVGGAVTDLLAEPWTRHEFRVYDSLLYEESYRKPVPFFRGDVRDHDRLLPHLRWADCVIWLAALVGDAACALDPAATIEINQESVQWLSENFRGRIIFMSTCSVYGAADTTLDEDSPTNPLSVYAKTKLAAESHVIDWPGSNAIVFRLGTLFGLGDTYSRVRFDLVLNTLTLRAHQEGRITVFGGKQYRPLLHVRDAARAVVDQIETRAAGIYNLHYLNYSISELASHVGDQFPGLEIVRTPQHFEDHRNCRVDGMKAAKDLRFYPRYSLVEGITEIKSLLEEGRVLDPGHARHYNSQFLAAQGVR